MKFASFNVNGYRAVLGKGFRDWLAASGADVVGLQEIKVRPEELEPEDREPAGWQAVWNPATVKKGYSGTAVFSRKPALSAALGLSDPVYKGEGRLVRLEFPDYYFFNVYFPNGQMSEERLAYKLGYYEAFLAEAQELRKTKPIVVCGDFNTAHKEIDLARPKENEKTSGFLPVERAFLDRFTQAGYLDVFRLFDPEPGRYTWWSFRAGARKRNVGWRIDYFYVSEELRDRVVRAWIEPEVQGSDHCPIGLELKD